jgi:hypothetical protein
MKKITTLPQAQVLRKQEQKNVKGGCTPYCGQYCYLKCRFGPGGPSYNVMEIPGCAYSENYCAIYFGMELDGCYCEGDPGPII